MSVLPYRSMPPDDILCRIASTIVYATGIMQRSGLLIDFVSPSKYAVYSYYYLVFMLVHFT